MSNDFRNEQRNRTLEAPPNALQQRPHEVKCVCPGKPLDCVKVLNYNDLSMS